MAAFRKKLAAVLTREPGVLLRQRAFLTFMDQEKIGLVLAFIILVRSGEFMVSSMVSAFVVDLGIKTPLRLDRRRHRPARLHRRRPDRRLDDLALRPEARDLALPAGAEPDQRRLHAAGERAWPVTSPSTPAPRSRSSWARATWRWWPAFPCFEQFASGLGTAVLTTFLMRICKMEFKAAHFAIGSGLMSLGGIVAGVSSGFIASWLGYSGMFLVSFLISIPGMVLLFWVPKK